MAFHLHSYWLMKWPTCKKNYVLLSLRRASCVLLSISRNILILYKGLIFEKVLIFKLRVLYSIKGILQSITEWVCTMMDFFNDCDPDPHDGKIMAPMVQATYHKYYWTRCSRESMARYIQFVFETPLSIDVNMASILNCY